MLLFSLQVRTVKFVGRIDRLLRAMLSHVCMDLSDNTGVLLLLVRITHFFLPSTILR